MSEHLYKLTFRAPAGVEWDLNSLRSLQLQGECPVGLFAKVVSGMIRSDCFLAELVYSVLEAEPCRAEMWPGYKEAVEDFMNAAVTIINGWDLHNDQKKEKHGEDDSGDAPGGMCPN